MATRSATLPVSYYCTWMSAQAPVFTYSRGFQTKDETSPVRMYWNDRLYQKHYIVDQYDSELPLIQRWQKEKKKTWLFLIVQNLFASDCIQLRVTKKMITPICSPSSLYFTPIPWARRCAACSIWRIPTDARFSLIIWRRHHVKIWRRHHVNLWPIKHPSAASLDCSASVLVTAQNKIHMQACNPAYNVSLKGTYSCIPHASTHVS